MLYIKGVKTKINFMKKIILILLILISLKAIAQGDFKMKVTYNEKLNFDIPINKISQLIFNNTQSYYIEKTSKEVFDTRNTKVYRYGKEEFKKIINIDLEKDSIFIKTLLDGNYFLVQEKLRKISWKIHKKINDIILGFKSTKATGYFRGRIYTAWFTEEIPTKFGPWKLHGLPGLILEVKDNLNEIQFIVEKIEYIKKSKKYFNFEEDKKYEKISLREYNKKINKSLKDNFYQIISRLPKGSKVMNIKFKKYRGIELKYEWEKE